MKKQGDIYKFHVFHTGATLPNGQKWEGWVYEIYTQFDDVLVIESSEWFDSQAEAGFAAVGHISLLENGEG